MPGRRQRKRLSRRVSTLGKRAHTRDGQFLSRSAWKAQGNEDDQGMTTHRQKTLIRGAEPESLGKQIRRGTTLQSRKLLPWLFVGLFLWVHVVHGQGTADTARTSAAVTEMEMPKRKQTARASLALRVVAHPAFPRTCAPFSWFCLVPTCWGTGPACVQTLKAVALRRL